MMKALLDVALSEISLQQSAAIVVADDEKCAGR